MRTSKLTTSICHLLSSFITTLRVGQIFDTAIKPKNAKRIK